MTLYSVTEKLSLQVRLLSVSLPAINAVSWDTLITQEICDSV